MEKGLGPDIVMRKVLAVYNHSVHSVTGFTLFEVLFGFHGRQRDYGDSAANKELTGRIKNNNIELGKLWESIHWIIGGEKRRRGAQENLKVKDLTGEIKIGTIVYRQLSSNRG